MVLLAHHSRSQRHATSILAQWIACTQTGVSGAHARRHAQVASRSASGASQPMLPSEVRSVATPLRRSIATSSLATRIVCWQSGQSGAGATRSATAACSDVCDPSHEKPWAKALAQKSSMKGALSGNNAIQSLALSSLSCRMATHTSSVIRRWTLSCFWTAAAVWGALAGQRPSISPRPSSRHLAWAQTVPTWQFLFSAVRGVIQPSTIAMVPRTCLQVWLHPGILWSLAV
mmetsp:Transcript_30456/g.66974  ORF Transcript_30456/g.66974 Transcript_30456/m.66974 type:complete len:231 (+) Transcript_30456:1563-2255(+)